MNELTKKHVNTVLILCSTDVKSKLLKVWRKESFR
jgi:hypothetical protein